MSSWRWGTGEKPATSTVTSTGIRSAGCGGAPSSSVTISTCRRSCGGRERQPCRTTTATAQLVRAVVDEFLTGLGAGAAAGIGRTDLMRDVAQTAPPTHPAHRVHRTHRLRPRDRGRTSPDRLRHRPRGNRPVRSLDSRPDGRTAQAAQPAPDNNRCVTGGEEPPVVPDSPRRLRHRRPRPERRGQPHRRRESRAGTRPPQRKRHQYPNSPSS